MKKFIEFLKDVTEEAKKVTWPGKKELTGATLLVIILILFISLFIALVDFILAFLLRGILG